MTTFAIPRFSDLTSVLVQPSPATITATMLDLMAEQPRKVIDLADLLGCDQQKIISRLRRLEVDRKVQRQRVNNPQGFYYLWHIAVPGRTLPTIFVGPVLAVEEEEVDVPGAGLPRRQFSKTWAPHNRRDDLVSALFGPARKEVA
jgi:hypothetical protein